jgi:hypothetical protein
MLSNLFKLISNHVEDEEMIANLYDLVCNYLGITNKTEKTSIPVLDTLKTSSRKLIALDFDGVLHNRVHGSHQDDSTIISNGPVPGAIDWLNTIVNDNRFFITIFSARSKVLGFEDALRTWFKENGMDQNTINKISICSTKPPAYLFIDDRAWKFSGKFPSSEELLKFRAWHEKQ